MCQSSGAVSMEDSERLRVIAFVPVAWQPQMVRQLASIGASVVCIERAADLFLAQEETGFCHVILLPAILPEADAWTIWGALTSWTPRPAFLVYAHEAGFQLWSGVLEAGGYDVITEPFTDEALQAAVLLAAESVRLRND